MAHHLAYRGTVGRPPELETERTYLSGLTLDDAEAVFRYASNPRVTLFMTWGIHESLEDSIGFLERLDSAPNTQLDWGIRLKPDARMVGAIEFSLRDSTHAEIHYTLDEPYWGQGLMSEVAARVVDWAFSTYPRLERITSSAVEENRRSTRVMEKVGMHLSGSSEEGWKDGSRRRMVEYRIQRAEWETALPT